MSEKKEPRSLAPFVIFGGILAIGITTTTIVAVGHCGREEPYLDAVRIKKRYRRQPLTPSADNTRDAQPAVPLDAGTATPPE